MKKISIYNLESYNSVHGLDNSVHIGADVDYIMIWYHLRKTNKKLSVKSASCLNIELKSDLNACSTSGIKLGRVANGMKRIWISDTQFGRFFLLCDYIKNGETEHLVGYSC